MPSEFGVPLRQDQGRSAPARLGRRRGMARPRPRRRHDATLCDQAAERVVARRRTGGDDVGHGAPPDGNAHLFPATDCPQRLAERPFELTNPDLTHVVTLAPKGSLAPGPAQPSDSTTMPQTTPATPTSWRQAICSRSAKRPTRIGMTG